MSKYAEMESMNLLASKGFDNMSYDEQKSFINDVYINVRRYTKFIFNRVGRQTITTLQQDVFENIVQEVTFNLVDLLKKDGFDSSKAKFSTLLGKYVENRVFREKHLDSMKKRQGTTVRLEFEDENGITTEYLPSNDNTEEEALDRLENTERSEIIKKAMSKLKSREQLIVTMRMNDKTLEVIGQELNISRERVRQILEKCFRVLRKELKDKF